MKIAVPVDSGKLTVQFGQSEEFALVAVEDDKITGVEIQAPPPGEPGLLPKWLKKNGVSVVIAGGMGARAIRLLQQNGIEVHSGTLREKPEEAVRQYLDNAGEPAARRRED